MIFQMKNLWIIFFSVHGRILSYYINKSVKIYMAGFLSENQINKINSLADTLHTTFAKTITVYKNAKKTLIASTTSWNSLYRRTNTGSNTSL